MTYFLRDIIVIYKREGLYDQKRKVNLHDYGRFEEIIALFVYVSRGYSGMEG